MAIRLLRAALWRFEQTTHQSFTASPVKNWLPPQPHTCSEWHLPRDSRLSSPYLVNRVANPLQQPTNKRSKRLDKRSQRTDKRSKRSGTEQGDN